MRLTQAIAPLINLSVLASPEELLELLEKKKQNESQVVDLLKKNLQ